MKQILLKTWLMVVCLLFGVGTSWAENYATWTFASGTAGTNYPSNNAAFSATSGSCSKSTYTMNGSGSQWNSTKGYAFTAVTDMTVTLKLTGNLAAGSSVVFAADMYYNKDSNAPMTGFNLTVSENNGSYVTTGLSATSISLSTSSANKSVTYTTQSALTAGQTISLKYTQTGKAGAGQGYVGNITIDGPSLSSGGGSSSTKYDVTIANNIEHGTVTASPTSAAEGAEVTLTATPATGYMLGYWNVTNASTSKGITVTDNKFTMPAANVNVSATFVAIPEKTVAEFIENEGGMCYLTGIVSNIANTTYGNFDLADESGTIYVYGCLTADKQSGKFNTLDVVAGDKIKVLADEYVLFGEKAEAKNVIFVEKIPYEKPQYTVTIVAPTNGTLVVKEGESVINSGDKVEQGKTLTIECTPTDAESYRYKNWQYKEDGNWITMEKTMTRTVTQDISIRANFEAIPVYTVAWSVNGSIVKSEDLKEGAAVTAPDNYETPEGKVFTGWIETSTVEGETPAYVTPSATATENVTYYAVFATFDSEATPDQWQTTSLSALTSNDVFVMASGTKAISSANGTSGNPAAVALTVSAGKITSQVTDDIKWTLTGNATDGYTFYKNGSTNYIYVNTTATSSSNTCIRVGTQSSNVRNKWKPDNNGRLKTNDSYTARYLSFYSTGSDFRGYINTDNGAFAPTFYKFIPGEDPYSDYSTTPGRILLDENSASTKELVEEGVDVLVVRTLKADIWNTLCLPFDMDEDQIAANFGDDAEVKSFSGLTISGDNYSLQFTDASTIDAGTAYMVRVTTPVTEINVSGVDVVMDDHIYNCNPQEDFDDDENVVTVTFQGNYYTQVVPTGSYIISSNKFYLVDSTVTNKGFRGYFNVEVDDDSAGSNKARNLSFSFDDVLTGIEGVNVVGLDENIYDLQGRRVQRLQQGVNIVNGKKVIR